MHNYLTLPNILDIKLGCHAQNPPIQALKHLGWHFEGRSNEIPYDAAQSVPEFPLRLNNLPPRTPQSHSRRLEICFASDLTTSELNRPWNQFRPGIQGGAGVGLELTS
jgi:hypothetical protein